MMAWRRINRQSNRSQKLIHIYEEAALAARGVWLPHLMSWTSLSSRQERSSPRSLLVRCRECGECEVVCKLALTRRYPGEPLPMVSRADLDPYYMTNVPGLYLIGEAAGKALVRHASNLGSRTIQHIVHNGLGSERPDVALDVVIVGSGPGGLSAALAAETAGLKYLVLEKGADFAQTIRNYPKGKPVQNQPVTTADIGALPLADTQQKSFSKCGPKLWLRHPFRSSIMPRLPASSRSQGRASHSKSQRLPNIHRVTGDFGHGYSGSSSEIVWCSRL